MKAPVVQEERPLGELVAELAAETGTLVRQEVQLATAEMTEKAKTAAKQAVYVGAGGALAYGGFLALLGALVLGLGNVMPMWLAALLVGAVVVAAGYVVAHTGLAELKRLDPVPRQTAKTLRDNKVWLRKELAR